MPERKPVNPAGAAPNPALSPGMIVGDFLFVSGHVAVDTVSYTHLTLPTKA